MTTTGKTVQEATERALDQLGVHADEAQVEVVEEPKAKFLGLSRTDAKVRARVMPLKPRPKRGRSKREGGGGRNRQTQGGNRGGRGGGGGKRGRSGARGSGDDRHQSKRGGSQRGGGASGPSGGNPGDGERKPAGSGSGEARNRGNRRTKNENDKRSGSKDRPINDREEKNTVADEEAISASEQGDLVADFLSGMLDAFDADGDIVIDELDDDTVEVRVEGEDLGLLIGSGGSTMTSIQELARTYVKRQATEGIRGRVFVDVGGFRQRRREALEGFSAKVAAQALDSGAEVALEAMNSADRKIVHDAMNDIDGVSTISEGEDPNRRVVVIPDAAD
ncbi:MAG: KH domain-containing protein [Actinomycetia bacterium]|nr:KH domain-containing protein [Actinomycetes bacterium]